MQKFKNQRQPSVGLTTKTPKTLTKTKFKPGPIQDKESILNTLNNTISNGVRNKKLPVSFTTTTTDFSPYFYAVSNSKIKLDHDSMVKHYLKFVKNVTITYPVMIPSRDVVFDKKNYKKSQKLKEKSRDINFNHNMKAFLQKTTEKPIGKEW